MAKGNNKLIRLKSVLKKLNSFNSRGRQLVCRSNDSIIHSDSGELHEIFVGKTMRRYLVSSEVINHPIFLQLAAMSSDREGNVTTVPCEVVFFDHLLWMLDNSEDPESADSVDELVGFYAC